MSHDKFECLDRKLHLAFDMLFHLIRMLAEGSDPALMALAQGFDQGQLDSALLIKRISDLQQKDDNVHNRDILKSEVCITSDLEVVGRLNSTTVTDMRTGETLAVHDHHGTSVLDITEYNRAVKLNIRDGLLMRSHSGSQIIDVIDTCSPLEMVKFIPKVSLLNDAK